MSAAADVLVKSLQGKIARLEEELAMDNELKTMHTEQLRGAFTKLDEAAAEAEKLKVRAETAEATCARLREERAATKAAAAAQWQELEEMKAQLAAVQAASEAAASSALEPLRDALLAARAETARAEVEIVSTARGARTAVAPLEELLRAADEMVSAERARVEALRAEGETLRARLAEAHERALLRAQLESRQAEQTAFLGERLAAAERQLASRDRALAALKAERGAWLEARKEWEGEEGGASLSQRLRVAEAEAESLRAERDALRRRLDSMPVVSADTLRRGGVDVGGSHFGETGAYFSNAHTPVKVLPVGAASTLRVRPPASAPPAAVQEPPMAAHAGPVEEDSGFQAVRGELREAADKAARMIASMREREATMLDALTRSALASGRTPLLRTHIV